jgi:hypothetical protein
LKAWISLVQLQFGRLPVNWLQPLIWGGEYSPVSLLHQLLLFAAHKSAKTQEKIA